MAVFKKKAANRVRFIQPHKTVEIQGAAGVRVYALGPPRNTDLLHSPNPTGKEEFHSLAAASPSAYMAAAAAGTVAVQPFARRYAIPWADAFSKSAHDQFFMRHYGIDSAPAPAAGSPPAPELCEDEAPDNAAWRRIDSDWLQAAGQLALDMNNDTNNGSLVLAFELGTNGKVLLFAGDAQRGNWRSWTEKDWPDRTGGGKITARDLLARTVLYKVGHHGSHNATLNGSPDDLYANLSWMGTQADPREFIALITAVREWADTQKGWDHPLKAIKDALLKKAGGRVLQTDTALGSMTAPTGAGDAWEAFLSRTRENRLYFDVTVGAG